MSPVAGQRRKPHTFDELWEALEQVPEGFLGEIVNGEVVASPRPGAPHTGTTSDLGVLLGAWFRFGIGGPGGWVIWDEPRIRFSDLVRVPDLGGWRIERFAAPDTGPVTVIPDWICEVLSPGTARSDRTEKMPLYARQGVGHLWIIEPLAQVLEVFRLVNGSWLLVGSHGGDDKVRAEPFDAVELDLTMIWGPKRQLEDPGDP